MKERSPGINPFAKAEMYAGATGLVAAILASGNPEKVIDATRKVPFSLGHILEIGEAAGIHPMVILGAIGALCTLLMLDGMRNLRAR